MRNALVRVMTDDPALRVFVARFDDRHDTMIEALDSLPGVDLVGTGASGTQIVAALRGSDPDAVLFPVDRADLARTIRISSRAAIDSPPFFVAAAEEITRPLIVKAALSGFDAMVGSTTPPDALGTRLGAIVEGRVRLRDEPILRDLGLPPGLLARGLHVDAGVDTDIADLVGAGLSDEDVSVTMGLPVQTVRNRIEHILHSNGLSYRTQLAVMRAAFVKVPDFS